MYLVLVIARDLPVSTEIVLDPLCCYFETEILPSWIHHYLPPAIQASILQALDVQDIHVRRLSERGLESLSRTVRDVFRHSDLEMVVILLLSPQEVFRVLIPKGIPLNIDASTSESTLFGVY